MLTCKKTYRDIPFAHRQHLHAGHCALIHGHNWAITLTFACRETDASGFVVDFGDLKYIKSWIDTHLDHACLFNEDDGERHALIDQFGRFFKPYIVASCSCEGLARHLYEVFNPLLDAQTAGRVWLVEVEVEEDSKNSAAYRPD
jgi:6-pyruvoyltetrahydropterin/6-carboxytetrahydropterin synthase